MGSPRRLLAAALLAVGLSVPASLANAADLPVRLLAPAEGAVLQGGSTAVLEWAPRPGLASPGEWEEWEAFLSLDGGATYPFRLTPHLDRDLRRVTFKVPSFPTGRARLLLRVGDERRELAFALPQSFAIAVPPGAPARSLDLERRAWRRGEPARPGDLGVLAWVEGTRDGGAMREVVAAERAGRQAWFRRRAERGAGRPLCAARADQAQWHAGPPGDLRLLRHAHGDGRGRLPPGPAAGHRPGQGLRLRPAPLRGGGGVGFQGRRGPDDASAELFPF